jgi:hypothetical protein
MSIIFHNIRVYQLLSACRIIKELDSEFASSICLEGLIQHVPRLWHLPNQVGKWFGLPLFMEVKVSIGMRVQAYHDFVAGATL